jgi:hypothetical protein
MITNNAVTDITIHKITPCNNGRKPTDLRRVRDKPEPIRNKVRVNPALAIITR